jgi:hypothetical protein
LTSSSKQEDSERARIEFERARLSLDSATFNNDKYRVFLELWRTQVQPYHEHRLMSREQAYGFAKTTLQTIIVLNGGALIAFPAFAQLIGPTFQQNITWSIISIGLFVLGLVLGALSGLLSYLSMSADADSLYYEEEAAKADLNKSMANSDAQGSYESIRNEALNKQKKSHGKAYTLAYWAIRFGIFSILSFMIGAFFSGLVLFSYT